MTAMKSSIRIFNDLQQAKNPETFDMAVLPDGTIYIFLNGCWSQHQVFGDDRDNMLDKAGHTSNRNTTDSYDYAMKGI